MIRGLQFDAGRLRQAAEEGHLLATDLADYLVRKGLPFREAYAVVGSMVEYALKKGKTFAQLSLSEYQGFSNLFEEDVRSLTTESSLGSRDLPGGTAPRQVESALERARRMVESE